MRSLNVAAAPFILLIIALSMLFVPTFNAGDVELTKVWDVTPPGPVYKLDIGRESNVMLAATVFPASIELYDLRGGPKLIWSYELGSDVYVQTADLSPDGNEVAMLVFWQGRAVPWIPITSKSWSSRPLTRAWCGSPTYLRIRDGT